MEKIRQITSLTNLNPTDQLLILGARTEVNEELVQRTHSLLEHSIDWETLLTKAGRHAVAPLLYHTLSGPGNGLVPADVLETLANSYYVCMRRNILFSHALGQVLVAFQEAGVPVIVLKGAALAEAVYGNIALRPMGDVDLLVRFDDLPAIERVLDRLGYAPPAGILAPAYYQHNHFHIPYHGDIPEVTLEVHWGLQEDFGLLQPNLDEVWQGAVQEQVAGVETLVMGLEDLLLYLCLHLDKHGYYNRYLLTQPDAEAFILDGHGFNELIWFCDVWEVLQQHQQEVDWPRFVEKARRWGIEGPVYSSLYFVQRLFGPSLAVHALTELRPPRLRWHERILYRFIANLASSAPGDGRTQGWLRRRLLSMSPDLQFRPARLISLPGHIFPGREAIARHYGVHGPAVGLYYLGHVIRALARSGLGAARLAYYLARRRWDGRQKVNPRGTHLAEPDSSRLPAGPPAGVSSSVPHAPRAGPGHGGA